MGVNDRGPILILDGPDSGDVEPGGSRTSWTVPVLALGLFVLVAVGVVSGGNSGGPPTTTSTTAPRLDTIQWNAARLVDPSGRAIDPDVVLSRDDRLYALVDQVVWTGTADPADRSVTMQPSPVSTGNGPGGTQAKVESLAVSGSLVAAVARPDAQSATACSPETSPSLYVSDDAAQTWTHLQPPWFQVDLGTNVVTLSSRADVAAGNAGLVLSLELVPQVNPKCVAERSDIPRYSVRGVSADSVIALLGGEHVHIDLERLGLSAAEQTLWSNAYRDPTPIRFSWALIDGSWREIEPAIGDVKGFGSAFLALAEDGPVMSNDGITWADVDVPAAAAGWVGDRSTVMVADAAGWSAVSFDAGGQWLPIERVSQHLTTALPEAALVPATAEPIGLLDGLAAFWVQDESGASLVVTAGRDIDPAAPLP